MRFLVIGCGSIGKRHIKNLLDLGVDIIVFDISREKVSEVEKKYRVRTFTDLERAFSQILDAVLICTPTSTHTPLALHAAQKGHHLFIEKPISSNLDGIDELAEITVKKNLIVLVGCNTRFSPSLKLAKKLVDDGQIGRVLSIRAAVGYYLPYWHPQEDYRKSYSANRSLGGGVILDDIHELDYLHWIFGEVKEVFCIAERVSNLEIDAEDVAEIFLKFKSGTIAQVHLDYLQRTYRRSCEIIGENGVIIWDYIDKEVKLYTQEDRHWETFADGINVDHNQMFIDEMKHFISSIEGREESINDIYYAKDVLKVALAAYESSRTKQIVRL